MKMSTEGLIALIGHEGIVLSRYLDSVKVWTIGVGHTKAAGGIDPATYKGTLTMKQALDMLRVDIVKYENGVNAAVKAPLEQHEFDALVSFHYNTGAISKATLTKTLNGGNKALAGKQMMNWVKPPEIRGRREAEMNLFLSGKYPAPMATVYPADANGKVLWNKGTRVNVEQLLNTPKPIIPLDVPMPDAPVPTFPKAPIDAPAVVVPGPVPSGGWLAAIVNAIAAAFNGRSA